MSDELVALAEKRKMSDELVALAENMRECFLRWERHVTRFLV